MAKTPHGSDAQSADAAFAIFRISPSRSPSSRISTAAVHEASNRLFSAVVRTISPSRPSLSACVENPLAAEAMRAFHDCPSGSDSRSILIPLASLSSAWGTAGGSGACARKSAATATMERITPQNNNGIFQPVVVGHVVFLAWIIRGGGLKTTPRLFIVFCPLSPLSASGCENGLLHEKGGNQAG